MSESKSASAPFDKWRGFVLNVGVAILGTILFVYLQSRMIVAVESLPAIFLLVIGVKIAMRDVPDLKGRQRMAVRAAVVIASVGVSGWLSFPKAPDRTLDWQPYSGKVLAAAVASGRPTVVDFYADWCPPCRAMDRQVFSREDVAAKLDAFNLIRVDASNESDPLGIEASQRFAVFGFPTFVFIDAKGEEVRGLRLLGPEYHARFLKRIEAVLGGE